MRRFRSPPATIGVSLLSFVWLICAVFVTLSSSAEAQTANPARNAPTSLRRLDVGRASIKQLREGQIEPVLKSLESVADEPPTVLLADEDCVALVCAGLHRFLSQLSSNEQFEFLSKWSISSDTTPKVRVITALVPTIAPPPEFARALGERPRNTSFPISAIGDVRGIFSTGWSLVIAARESGKLKRLMADLGPLVDKKVPNADLLMALAQIADGRGGMTKLVEQLSERTSQIKNLGLQNNAGLRAIDPADLLLATAALQHPELAPIGEMMLGALADTNGQMAASARSFLRHAQASVVLFNHKNRGESKSKSQLAPQFKFWTPVSGSLAASNSPETTESIWLACEDHILHLAGSGNDTLLFRYPLQGDFQFQCESQIGGSTDTDSGLTYGGLGFQLQANNQLRLIDTNGKYVGNRPCPFLHPASARAPTFNRVSIRSTPDSATMAVNLHPIWTDKVGLQSSPWLGLRSLDKSRPLFRNFKIAGQPIIPRSVRLVDGNELRGWHSRIFGQDAPQASKNAAAWKLSDGVIRAAKRVAPRESTSLEEGFWYQRPLLGGEAVSYEFFYESGVQEVSPALGRVVFLLQPDGIRIHWLTDGDHDWSLLAPDNAVTEPLNRRGPRPLPLKANDWNRVTVARTDAALTLSLNDTLVYQRPIDWLGDHRFGFYRPQAITGVQLRNVVLTGDWPQSLPQEFIDHPTSTIGEPTSDAQQHAYNRLFKEEFLSDNVLAFRRRVLAMPASPRFELLSNWVLPGQDHPGFRMTGDFTQTRPAPVVQEPSVAHSELGGELVSPVFDWLDAAKEMGLLRECRKRVEQAKIPGGEFQQRARASLLVLLSLELGDEALLPPDFEKLMSLLKAQTPTGSEDQWPETLVSARGADRFATNALVSDFVSYLYARRTVPWQPAGIPKWHTHNASRFGRLQLQLAQLQSEQSHEAALETYLESNDWIPTTAAHAETAAKGFPNPLWSRRDSAVVKRSGHKEDYLFYRIPLSGNYEVECDLVNPTQLSTQILIAGIYVGMDWGDSTLAIGSIRTEPSKVPVNPPLVEIKQSMRYRGVVRDGAYTVYLNGRQVHQTRLDKQPDPWIAIRAWGWRLGSVRDLRITGRPTVLDAVPLSTSKDLTGWIDYHETPGRNEDGRWVFVNDPQSGPCIIGRPNANRAGMFSESLLRYERPLIEDGSIEYEFFYQSGDVDTHPALDRLAFVLRSSGVCEHWITDGKHDRTDLAPDNMTDVPQRRHGPAELPLRPEQWNHLKLTLHGATARIELNGTLIYERDLESTNQRTFGLFRYADVTEGRVRNVVMRGDWPKALPPPADQELADKNVTSIDADRSRLKAVFTHDFQKDGLSDQYLIFPDSNGGKQMKLTAEGIEISKTKIGTIEIVPRFSLEGDFDIEAAFCRLRNESKTTDAGIRILTTLDEPLHPAYEISRIVTGAGKQLSYQARTLTQPGGGRAWLAVDYACESTSGRLRISRRKGKMFFLFADGDSENFRVFDVQLAPDTAVERNGVQLQSLCPKIGKCEVVWKDVVLRAERMNWYPELAGSISLMNADGSGDLRTIISPTDFGFTTAGSPEWSADGRKIVFDMTKGSVSSSHVFIANSDGTEPKDLGLGCMPSLSKDGRNIVFSQMGQGLVTMKSDGSDRRIIDSDAWGAQWSPDGKSIAYGKAGNIVLQNVDTGESRQLLVGERATRYSMIHWNPTWSHDGRYIVFAAINKTMNVDELAVVDVNSEEGFKVLQPNARSIRKDFTWTPENEHVVAVISGPSGQPNQFYLISRTKDDPPRLLEVQPKGHSVNGGAWSRDGKAIVIASQKYQPPVEWVTEPASNAQSR